MTNSHNWPFDNAWQEMLNHATNKVQIHLFQLVEAHFVMVNVFKVAEAEKKKAEAHAEHQRKALICNKAESEVSNQLIEE